MFFGFSIRRKCKKKKKKAVFPYFCHSIHPERSSTHGNAAPISQIPQDSIPKPEKTFHTSISHLVLPQQLTDSKPAKFLPRETQRILHIYLNRRVMKVEVLDAEVLAPKQLSGHTGDKGFWPEMKGFGQR